MEKRFNGLRFVATVYLFAGVFIFIIGTGTALIGLVTNAGANFLSSFLIFFVSALLALLLIAISQGSELLIDVEKHTRDSATTQQAALAVQQELAERLGKLFEGRAPDATSQAGTTGSEQAVPGMSGTGVEQSEERPA